MLAPNRILPEDRGLIIVIYMNLGISMFNSLIASLSPPVLHWNIVPALVSFAAGAGIYYWLERKSKQRMFEVLSGNYTPDEDIEDIIIRGQ